MNKKTYTKEDLKKSEIRGAKKMKTMIMGELRGRAYEKTGIEAEKAILSIIQIYCDPNIVPNNSYFNSNIFMKDYE